MTKQRLDVELTARGLAESRQKAQAMIMAGQVYVDGRKVDKAGTQVGPGCAIEVRGRTLAYVSRGTEAGEGGGALAHPSGGGGVCRHRLLHRRLHRLHAPAGARRRCTP